MEYNITGYLYLNVDNKTIVKQVKNRILFDKPLLLLIGQNPAFKNPFQVRIDRRLDIFFRKIYFSLGTIVWSSIGYLFDI
jgi:hypothetical protein